MALACQRCKQAFAPPLTLGESYVVLPQPSGDALPNLTDSAVGRSGPLLHAASMHEQLRTVSRLLELSERCDPIECGVPLCEECASAVLRELQRRLEEAHQEHEMLQAAFAELEAGEEEDEIDQLTDEQVAREVESQRQEEAELRASIAAAEREREALAEEASRLGAQCDAVEADEEARHPLCPPTRSHASDSRSTRVAGAACGAQPRGSRGPRGSRRGLGDLAAGGPL